MKQAAESFEEAVKSLQALALDVVGLINVANELTAECRGDLAVALYKLWLDGNPGNPARYVAAYNGGSLLLASGDLAGARDLLGLAVDVNPDFAPARLNLANAYERLGTVDLALEELRQVTARMASVTRENISLKVHALKNIARTLRGTEEAESALKQAVELDAAQRELVQHWVSARQARCVWPAVASVGALSAGDVRRMMAPLSMSMLVDDPLLQFATASADSMHAIRAGLSFRTIGHWPPPANSIREKLKIAYLSSDFCNHAVGYLISDVFEFHDRDRYEITVYNIGETTDDAIRQKIRSKVDRWVDIRTMGDKEAAAMIVGHGIDILLDMNGHTNYQRIKLLALKPAPVIANWLGYPGTMGTDFHDYIIADDFIIPESHEGFYSEKVLRLPCYQPNGRLQQVPALAKTRTELGLPEDALVFCCFNGAVKITEPVFSRWMLIMSKVPGSVLWLRGSVGDTDERLRREAALRGIAPERIVFLPFIANTEYLAAHRHADIFLDTFPYGAHTTASDALRMGVPIVTLAGLGFPSRVCGSLSRAAGMPDLICETPDAYVALAIELGNNRARRNEIRRRMAEQLPRCMLFDPAGLTVKLEQLFENMWSAYCAGAVHRAGLGNIEVLQAISAADDRNSVDFTSFDGYQLRQQLILASLA